MYLSETGRKVIGATCVVNGLFVLVMAGIDLYQGTHGIATYVVGVLALALTIAGFAVLKKR